MLTEIREKAQGFFAWVILLIIGVPFALWGIQNYTGSAGEKPVASVGSRDFLQKEVAQAASQMSQNFAGMNIPEDALKAQALKKLIGEEVMAQYVDNDGLEVSDDVVRKFVKGLPYFQVDGKFDEKQYKAVLNAQNMSPAVFAQRVKQSLKMEQFQKAVMDSNFATPYDINNVFKIQNQLRDFDYLKVSPVKVSAQPSEQEMQAYYQQHQAQFQTPEQVSLEYVELSAEALAKGLSATDEQLHTYYEEQKDQYSTKERRKISHILIATSKEVTPEQALQKASKIAEDLKSKDFAVVAKEVSDDKLSAEKGGDLGLYTPGVMEKDFDAAAGSLELGKVSAPIKSNFGYHLIKVTELVPGEVKAFAAVKDEVQKAYQKAQSENKFYETGEKLAQLSYENSGSLAAVAEQLQLPVQKTALLSKDGNEGIFSEPKVKVAAFSEEVLNGNNSEPVEMGSNRLVVVRMLEHKPAAAQAIKEVSEKIVVAINQEKEKQQVQDKVASFLKRLQAGEGLEVIASEQGLQVNKLQGIAREGNKLPMQLSEAVFKAAKPIEGKTFLKVELEKGEQALVSLNKVKEGQMNDEDKKKEAFAAKSIAKATGQSLFASVMKGLENEADVVVNQ